MLFVWFCDQSIFSGIRVFQVLQFFVGFVFCQSCEFCTILKTEEEEEQKEEEMEDVLVVEEYIMVNFPLYPSPLVSFICSSCSKVLPTKKKFKNHLIEMHKTPHHASSVTILLHARSYWSGIAPCIFYHPSAIELVKSLWEHRKSLEALGYLPH